MEETNKKILKLGLIGHHIAHSQSPEIFRKAHPDWEYDLIDVNSFQEGFDVFLRENYDAVNVTAPFKTEAYEKADCSDDVCGIIGASNLLIKEEGKIMAYNTDVLGAMTCLDVVLKKHFDGARAASSLRVLNIGLGGAGKSATVAALLMGFPTTCINRSGDVTREFQARLARGGHVDKSITDSQRISLKSLKIDDVAREGFSLAEIIAQHDIIIYSLPLALPFIDQVDFSDKVVIEPNYHNPSFPKVRCAKYIGGEVWLYAQAQTLLSMSV